MFRWYISWYIDLINMPRGYINWRLSLPPLGTILPKPLYFYSDPNYSLEVALIHSIGTGALL